MRDEFRTCEHCGETLHENERHHRIRNMHDECALRVVLGSVAHIERRCSCYIDGADEGDPPGLSRRDAAKAAWLSFHGYSSSGVN
jgi:hypothetical protein